MASCMDVGRIQLGSIHMAETNWLIRHRLADLAMGMTFVPFAGMGYGALKAFTKDDASPVQAEAAKMLIKDTDPKSEQALINASKHKSCSFSRRVRSI
jgi:hypothetical protein